MWEGESVPEALRSPQPHPARHGALAPSFKLTLAPKSRAAAVSRAMAGELRDLAGRDRRERELQLQRERSPL